MHAMQRHDTGVAPVGRRPRQLQLAPPALVAPSVVRSRQVRPFCPIASTSSLAVRTSCCSTAPARSTTNSIATFDVSRIRSSPLAARRTWQSGKRTIVLCLCSQESAAFSSSSSSSAHPFPEEEDFDLLSKKVADLSAKLKEELRGCCIYLVGMMGSGKSTVGKMLANTLKYAFFDTDVMVEMTHDKKPVSEIFQQYGQDYFRTCESEVLKQLAPYKNLVVATGGGAVIKPLNWSYMHSGVVVWLNGPTDLLAKRVAKDGLAKRPLLAPAPGSEPASDAGISEEQRLYQTAKLKLDQLLQDRTQFYENADLKVSLEGYGIDAEKGAPTVVVMYRLLTALKHKIDTTKANLDECRNIVIENNGEVPSLRVQPPHGGRDLSQSEGGQAA